MLLDIVDLKDRMMISLRHSCSQDVSDGPCIIETTHHSTKELAGKIVSSLNLSTHQCPPVLSMPNRYLVDCHVENFYL